ncbi:MAG: DUF1761 domain-containing protein [Saprospiraceae bacterium]|nr:DUF1761 domain-containing protein [Saprospiraceae bacterium]
MAFNWLALFVAALIPLLIGFVYYHEAVFGKAWMRESGVTPDPNAGMARIFGLTYLLSLMLATILQTVVIHQAHVMSLLMNEPGINDPASEMGKWLTDFMAKYGNNFRTFKHGALHGTIAAVFIALPIVGINSLFERKSGKYILLHTGYWIITLALMGGIVCGWK